MWYVLTSLFHQNKTRRTKNFNRKALSRVIRNGVLYFVRFKLTKAPPAGANVRLFLHVDNDIYNNDNFTPEPVSRLECLGQTKE